MNPRIIFVIFYFLHLAPLAGKKDIFKVLDDMDSLKKRIESKNAEKKKFANLDFVDKLSGIKIFDLAMSLFRSQKPKEQPKEKPQEQPKKDASENMKVDSSNTSNTSKTTVQSGKTRFNLFSGRLGRPYLVTMNVPIMLSLQAQLGMGLYTPTTLALLRANGLLGFGKILNDAELKNKKFMEKHKINDFRSEIGSKEQTMYDITAQTLMRPPSQSVIKSLPQEEANIKPEELKVLNIINFEHSKSKKEIKNSENDNEELDEMLTLDRANSFASNFKQLHDDKLSLQAKTSNIINSEIPLNFKQKQDDDLSASKLSTLTMKYGTPSNFRKQEDDNLSLSKMSAFSTNSEMPQIQQLANFDEPNSRMKQDQIIQYMLKKNRGEEVFPSKNVERSPVPAEPEDFGTGYLELANEFSAQGYRPIKIIYDDSFLRDSLKAIGKLTLLEDLKTLVKKADSFIRTYVWNRKEEVDIHVPVRYKYCDINSQTEQYKLGPSRFTKEINTKGDLLVFLFAIDDEKVTKNAAAKPCSKGIDGSANIGMLKFNIFYMLSSENLNSPFKDRNNLYTTIHELFHILAFHDFLFTDFQKKVTSKFPNLFKFKDHQENPLIKESHWLSIYLSNDLMTPSEREDAVLSVFSLEYVELANYGFKTQRTYLENNRLLEKIDNFGQFLSYTCPEQGKSRYESMCTKQEFKANQSISCHSSYLFLTLCNNPLLKNNCYERVAYPYGMCSDVTLAIPEEPFNTYGPDSRCFETGAGAICSKAKIVGDQVYIVGPLGEYLCDRKDSTVDLLYLDKSELYQITVKCPDPKDFIEAWKQYKCKHFCHNNGMCRDGKCFCFDGYTQESYCKDKSPSATVSVFMTSI